MMHYLTASMCTLGLTILLCACTHSNYDGVHATCPVLKSDIIFSGATSNVRNAQIQTTEKPLQQANYNNHCS
jgi:hypothetical protein